MSITKGGPGEFAVTGAGFKFVRCGDLWMATFRGVGVCGLGWRIAGFRESAK